MEEIGIKAGCESKKGVTLRGNEASDYAKGTHRYRFSEWSYEAVAKYRPSGDQHTRTTNLLWSWKCCRTLH